MWTTLVICQSNLLKQFKSLCSYVNHVRVSSCGFAITINFMIKYNDQKQHLMALKEYNKHILHLPKSIEYESTVLVLRSSSLPPRPLSLVVTSAERSLLSSASTFLRMPCDCKKINIFSVIIWLVYSKKLTLKYLSKMRTLMATVKAFCVGQKYKKNIYRESYRPSVFVLCFQ